MRNQMGQCLWHRYPLHLQPALRMTAPGRSHSSYDSSDSDLAEAGREGGGAASGLASTRVLVSLEL